MKAQSASDYEALLKRLQDKVDTTAKKTRSRRDSDSSDNLGWQEYHFPKLHGFSEGNTERSEKFLFYLNKELASAGYIAGERVIFLGHKTLSSFQALIDRYIKDYVQCPVCGPEHPH